MKPDIEKIQQALDSIAGIGAENIGAIVSMIEFTDPETKISKHHGVVIGTYEQVAGLFQSLLNNMNAVIAENQPDEEGTIH